MSVAVVVIVVVGLPQLVCQGKSAPLRKSKDKECAVECHRSSRLFILCCALMCVSAGKYVMMCVSAGKPWHTMLSLQATVYARRAQDAKAAKDVHVLLAEQD